jgi:hypothetical protein
MALATRLALGLLEVRATARTASTTAPTTASTTATTEILCRS